MTDDADRDPGAWTELRAIADAWDELSAISGPPGAEPPLPPQEREEPPLRR